MRKLLVSCHVYVFHEKEHHGRLDVNKRRRRIADSIGKLKRNRRKSKSRSSKEEKRDQQTGRNVR